MSGARKSFPTLYFRQWAPPLQWQNPLTVSLLFPLKPISSPVFLFLDYLCRWIQNKSFSLTAPWNSSCSTTTSGCWYLGRDPWWKTPERILFALLFWMERRVQAWGARDMRWALGKQDRSFMWSLCLVMPSHIPPHQSHLQNLMYRILCLIP